MDAICNKAKECKLIKRLEGQNQSIGDCPHHRKHRLGSFLCTPGNYSEELYHATRGDGRKNPLCADSFCIEVQGGEHE